MKYSNVLHSAILAISLCDILAKDLSLVELCKTPAYITYVSNIALAEYMHLDNAGTSFTAYEKHIQKENANWDKSILDESQKPTLSLRNNYEYYFRRLIYDNLQIKYSISNWLLDTLNMPKAKSIKHCNGIVDDQSIIKLYISNYNIDRQKRNKYFRYCDASYKRLNKTMHRLKPYLIKIYNKIVVKCIVAVAVFYDIDVKKAISNFVMQEEDKSFIGFLDT